jgi:hypothetical protein
MSKTLEKNLREIRCYGCTAYQLRQSIEESLTFKLTGPGMLVMGMMSDAQEEISRGMPEVARQTLNRAKYVLSHYMMQEI